MGTSSRQLTAVFSFLLGTNIILGCVLIHYAYIYYTLYKVGVPAITGRYPKYVLLTTLIGIIHFLCANLIVIAIGNELLYPRFDKWEVLYYIFAQISSLLFPILLSYRAWRVYFQIKWNVAVQDGEWHIFIDKNFKNNNWFITHYEWNKKYSFKICIFVWLCFAIPVIIFISIFGVTVETAQIRLALVGTEGFLPFLFMLIIFLKIPKYDDVFKVRREIKIVLFLNVIGFLLYVSVSMIVPPDVGTWNQIALISIAIVIPFGDLIIQILYPLYNFNLPVTICSVKYFTKHLYTNHSLVTELSMHSKSSNSTINIKEMNKSNCNNVSLQKKVLSDDNGLLAFARHVNKEFAIETIMFLIEIYQFKMKLIELFQDEITKMDHIFERLTFADSAPKSTVVLELDKDSSKQNVFLCAVKFFIKYIVEESQFAVN
eukprot:378652_1